MKTYLRLISLLIAILYRIGNVVGQCLSKNNICLICAYGYYNTLDLGQSILCEKQDDTTNLVMDVFIIDIQYSELLNDSSYTFATPNGSAEYPFDSLTEAFTYAQEKASKYLYSKINFLLLRNEELDLSLPPYYYLDPLDGVESKAFFRRLNAEISMSPCYCLEANSIRGCFNVTILKPVILLTSARVIFYVAGNFSVNDIIFDGSEIAYSENAYGLSGRPKNKKKRCNFYNTEIKEEEDEYLKWCFMRDRKIESSDSEIGFFNIETIIDYSGLVMMSQLKLYRVNFENFNYLEVLTTLSVFNSIIKAQQLSFNFEMINSTVDKIFLQEGFLCLNENIPDYYSQLLTQYQQARRNSIKSQIHIYNTTLKNYNYFAMSDAGSTCGVAFLDLFPMDIEINIFMSKFEGMRPNQELLQYCDSIIRISKQYSTSLKFDFSSNIVRNCSFTHIFYSKDNVDLNNSIYYEFTFRENEFNLNVDTNFFAWNATLLLTSNKFANHLLLMDSLVVVSYGNLYFNNNIAINITNTLTPLLEIFSPIAADAKKILSTPLLNANYTTDKISICNGVFDSISNSIFNNDNYFINSVLVSNNFFRNIDMSSVDLFYVFGVETLVYIKGNIFYNVAVKVVFYTKYNKDTALIENVFLNSRASFFFKTQIYSTSNKTRSIMNYSENILFSSTLEKCVESRGIYMGSSSNLTMAKNLAYSIMSSDTTFIKVNFYFAVIKENLFCNISNTLFLELEGFYEGSIFIANFYVFNKRMQTASSLFSIYNQQYSVLEKSFFFGGESAPSDANVNIEISCSNCTVIIKNSAFAFLKAKIGGALWLKVGENRNFLVENCIFYSNSAGFQAGDIIINTEFLNDNFMAKYMQEIRNGILNNLFFTSRGKEGGSISFQKSQVYASNNLFAQSLAEVDGGVVKSLDSTVFMFNNRFKQTISYGDGGVLLLINSNFRFDLGKAQNYTSKLSGGFAFLQDSNISISSSLLEAGSASIGGCITTFYSSISIIESNFSDTSAGFASSFYFEKSYIKLLSVKVSNNYAFESGAIIWSSPHSIFVNKFHLLNNTGFGTGTFHIIDSSQKTQILKGIICESNNMANGGCLYVRDCRLNISGLSVLNYVYPIDIIRIDSSRIKTILKFENVLITNCSFQSQLLYIFKSIVQFKHIFLDGGSIVAKSRYLIYSTESTIEINSFSFKGYINSNEEVPLHVFQGEQVNLRINFSSLNLGFNFAGFICLYCDFRAEDLIILRGHIQSGLTYNGASIHVENSFLSVKNSKISEGQSSFGAGIFCMNSQLELTGMIFNRNFADKKGSSVYFQCETGSENLLSIRDSHFIDNEFYGVAAIFATSVIIENSNFFQRNSKAESQAINVLNVAFLSLDKVYFKNFSDLGAIQIQSEDINCMINFVNIEVISCHNKLAGGAISMKGKILGNIFESIFLQNIAEDSGGVFFYSCKTQACNLTISSCKFIGNKAYKYGSVIKNDVKEANLNEYQNIFLNNWARGGTDKSGYPSLIYFVMNKPRYHRSNCTLIFSELLLKDQLEDVVTGSPVNITCLIFDQDMNPLIFESGGVLTFSKMDSNNGNKSIYLENEISSPFTDGFAHFIDFKVIATKNSSLDLILEYSNRAINRYFSQKVEFHLRNCIEGEIYSGSICLKCPEKFFSLFFGETEKCHSCPENAICPGGNKIIPLEGFWRKDAKTSKIVKCNTEEACPLGNVEFQTDFEFICGEGFLGNVCFNCESGFGKISNGLCLHCSANRLYFLRFSLALIAVSLVMILMFGLMNKNSEAASNGASFLMVVIEFSSMITLFFRFPINWSPEVKTYFSLNDEYLNAASEHSYMVECIFENRLEKDQKPFFNIFSALIVPFVHILLSILLLKIHCFLSQLYRFIQVHIEGKKISSINQNIKIITSNNFELVMALLYVNMKVGYTRILIHLFKLVSCQNIDDSGEEYLQAHPDKKCWGEDHLYYFYRVFIPSVIFWGILLPLAFTMYFRHLERRRKVSSTVFHGYNLYKFINTGRNTNAVFLELFLYLSKVFLAAFSAILSNFTSLSQVAIVILILLSNLYLHEAIHPFKVQTWNHARSISIITLMFLLGFSYLASVQNTIKPNLIKGYFIILLIIHALFALYMLFLGTRKVLIRRIKN